MALGLSDLVALSHHSVRRNRGIFYPGLLPLLRRPHRRRRQRLIASRLPRIRFHDTRHIHATVMLQAKVHTKVAAERMG